MRVWGFAKLKRSRACPPMRLPQCPRKRVHLASECSTNTHTREGERARARERERQREKSVLYTLDLARKLDRQLGLGHQLADGGHHGIGRSVSREPVSQGKDFGVGA